MSTPAERFRNAERRYEAVRTRWNALRTPEQRRQSGLHPLLGAAYAERQAAAAVVLRDAAPRHTIEEKPGVYLRLGADGRWEIDPITVDGNPLLGYDDGALNGTCTHDSELLDNECDVLARAATELPLPTLGELAVLLLDYLCRQQEPGLASLNLRQFDDQALDQLTAHLQAVRSRPDN